MEEMALVIAHIQDIPYIKSNIIRIDFKKFHIVSLVRIFTRNVSGDVPPSKIKIFS